MDVGSLVNTQSLLSASKLAENPLSLKVGQQLDLKVINADIQAAKNAVTLSLGGKDISVQSNQPVTLNPGQNLKVQVTQIAPTTEFKVVEPPPELKAQAAELRLKLIPTARDGGSAANSTELMRPTARDSGSTANSTELLRASIRDGGSAAIGKQPMQPARDSIGNGLTSPAVAEKQGNAALALPLKQLLDARIVNIAGNKIQLQLFEAGNKPLDLINIDRSQLANAPFGLKAGQSLNLEIVKTGAAPEFRIITAGNNIPEAKVAEFIKQFLPKHEASPIFLNQLIKDLPQLMKNPSVAQALKDIAAQIIRNLPPKEQLVTSQGLKQAIANSGLFLEAKLPAAMSQTELLKELPQLIKNESVPQSLQRIAVEILQNLTQKQPLLDSPSPEQPAASPKQAPEAESTPAKVIPANDGITAKTGNPELAAGDFKANLLKFIQALKQEINPQGEQPLNQVDLDLLKNLQHKTENTVAKLVLDQLMSLPKEDSPKQLWIIDIPFIDRQQAESVRIEVQQDKENKHQSEDNSDWSVNITITPPGLGTIHCIVAYRNNEINTFFKSQNSQTTELIKHNLDYLKNQLEESGLKTGHMDAHDGAEKIQATPSQQLSGKKLFDDKA